MARFEDAASRFWRRSGTTAGTEALIAGAAPPCSVFIAWRHLRSARIWQWLGLLHREQLVRGGWRHASARPGDGGRSWVLLAHIPTENCHFRCAGLRAASRTAPPRSTCSACRSPTADAPLPVAPPRPSPFAAITPPAPSAAGRCIVLRLGGRVGSGPPLRFSCPRSGAVRRGGGTPSFCLLRCSSSRPNPIARGRSSGTAAQRPRTRAPQSLLRNGARTMISRSGDTVKPLQFLRPC